MAKEFRKSPQAAIFNRPLEKLGTMLHRDEQPRRPNLPNLYTIGGDGVDHININFDGETELGQSLHQNAMFRFVHTLFGPFLTIEGFYRWLSSKTGDDEFRTLNGIQSSRFAKQTDNHNYVPNLRYFVMDATLQKINTYPELRAALVDSELPFDSYYYRFEIVNGKRTATRLRYKNAPWVIEGMNAIRKALKNGVEPNLDFLKDDEQEYQKQINTALKATLPTKVVNYMVRQEQEQAEPVKPKLIPNPPGTGKKAKARARRAERDRLAAEAEKDKTANDAVALVPVSVEGTSVDGPNVVTMDIQSICNNVLDENRGVVVEAALNMSGIETPDALKEMNHGGLSIIPMTHTPVRAEDVVVQPMSGPMGTAEVLQSMVVGDGTAKPENKFGRGLTSSILMLDDAPFQQRIVDPDCSDTVVIGTTVYPNSTNAISEPHSESEQPQTVNDPIDNWVTGAIEIGTSAACVVNEVDRNDVGVGGLDQTSAAMPEAIEATTNFGSFGVPSQQSFVTESIPVPVDKVEEVKPVEPSEQESH